MSELLCHKHQVEKECMGGRSAHISNWYCPECIKENEKEEEIRVSDPIADIIEFSPDTAEEQAKQIRQYFIELALQVIDERKHSDTAYLKQALREEFKLNKTNGQIAYEAAADVADCKQPWSEANQPKWEAAADAVQKNFVEQACAVINTCSYMSCEYRMNGEKQAYETALYDAEQTLQDRFK